MREIRCENEDGMAVVFGSSPSPFLLENCDGLYTVSNAVSTSENAMLDGDTYLGSRMQRRNIVLTLRDKTGADHQANRQVLYDLFKKGSKGLLTYTENGINRVIDYYVESITSDGAARARQSTVSLLCPDPYFYDATTTIVTMAAYTPQFEFVHEFVAGGEELGIRNTEKLRTIENTGAIDGIGLDITITASGPVTNPSVTHVENAETMQLGTDGYPFEMVLGDVVRITTDVGNKHIYRIRDGVQTEINEYLSEESVYIQLDGGVNTLGYAADSGADNLELEIRYRYKYMGV
jgi:hypothetical protein